MSDNKHYGGKSLGQIVDDLADQYFAQGMDAFYSGKYALLFVLTTLMKTEEAVANFFANLNGSDQEVRG